MAAQGLLLGVKVYMIDSKSEPDVPSDFCTHSNLNITLPGPAASIFGPEIDLKFTKFVENSGGCGANSLLGHARGKIT